MNQSNQGATVKRDKKILDTKAKQLSDQDKEDNKSLQKLELMSYLSS